MHRTHQRCLAITISFLVAGPAAPARGQSFTTIATPLQVPLHWQHMDLDPSKPRKLGISASLDGGTPQLFEFDTGGAGFYAAYGSGSSAAGVPYYQQLVVTGSLFVQKENQPFAATTGFIFDTGASMTIHNAATFSPFPAHLTKDHAGTEVVHGATFIANATSVSGSVQAFLDFTTGGQTDVDKVAVKYQADDPAYYFFNTGITPFTQNDFIYNLASHQVVMVPLPEPGVSLAAAAVAGLAWLVVRPGAVRPRTTSIPPSR